MAKKIKRKSRKDGKKASRKQVYETIWRDDGWCVVGGELRRGQGRPRKVQHLFKAVGEKLPFGCLRDVKKDVEEWVGTKQGIYIAHDSMGVPRYSGRGSIFTRLSQHFRAHPRELVYFSFYIVENKNHEREIETVIIRAAGPLLHFNERKKRVDIEPGGVRDYEPGTKFYQRQRKRGRQAKKKRRKRAG